MIAQRAKGNFLVAAMAAVPLSAQASVIDPAAPGFVPAIVPSGVGEALHKYLDRLPGHRRESDRGRLTALAYARGAGLDDPAWLAFAAALGYSAMVADLDALRRSPAADYLLQTTSAERGARPVTRLFHQALADELLAGGTSSATKARYSMCSWAKPRMRVGKAGTCVSTRPSMPPPLAG